MAPPRPLIRDLDALPTRDYDDYFEALRASTLSTLTLCHTKVALRLNGKLLGVGVPA
jgi:hypothetical protein